MAGGKKGDKGDKDDDIDLSECVLHSELADMLAKINVTITEGNKATNKSLDTLARSVSSLTQRVDATEKQRLEESANKHSSTKSVVNDSDKNNDNDKDKDQDFEDEDLGEDEEFEDEPELQHRLRNRLRRNKKGMGGNKGGNYSSNDDPFAKVKFTIPSFSGAYDAEAYLDWEMTVEQKFNSHLVPEQHRVRQATSEFLLLFGGLN